MKTLALLINKIEDLRRIDNPFEILDINNNNQFSLKMLDIHKSMEKYFGNMKVQRIYYGNEFCQYLIPKAEEFNNILKEADNKKVKVTLNTPFVTEFGIERLKKLFDLIRDNYPETEVVFNDWGVLLLLRELYPEINCIAGRLIDKSYRDPRFSQNDYNKYFSKDGLRLIRRSNITAYSYQSLLKQNNVQRVELDNLLQGYDFTEYEVTTKISLHVPFGVVITGRNCMMRALPLKDDEKFILENNFCHKKCQSIDQMMIKQVKPINDERETMDQWMVEMFRKGNTIFYKNSNFEKIYHSKWFDRIVYQLVL
jgi:hypothetical protein